MTFSQASSCTSLLPFSLGLYVDAYVMYGVDREADRARDYWKSKGGVNLTDLDKAQVRGQARAMIHNNRVSISAYARENES
jgi:hypothetical protein